MSIRRLTIGTASAFIFVLGTFYTAGKYSNYQQKRKFNNFKTELKDTFQVSEPEIAKMQKRIANDWTVSIQDLRDSLALDKKIKDSYKAGAQSVRDSLKNIGKIK